MSRLQHLASFASRREGDENFDPSAEPAGSEHDASEGAPRGHASRTRSVPSEGVEDSMKDQSDPEYSMEYEWRKSSRDKRSTDPSVKQVKKKRRLFGLEPHRRIKQHHQGSENLQWSRVRATLQEPFSEFLGVLVFTMVQQGGIAQATLSAGDPTAPGGNGYGQYITVPFCTGIGVLLGVYVAGDSGSYLNPAITVASCLFRGLPWRVLPVLTLAQVLGAFCGTGITFGIYLPAINAYSGGALNAPPAQQATASILTSFPQTFSSPTSQVFSIIQRTAIMQCVISAVKDEYNLGQQLTAGGSTNFPLNLFFLFFSLTAAFGWETGGQTNPALDLGGRIMASAVGYPNDIWTVSGGYPWIPIIVPVIGACFGSWLYDLLVFTGSSPVNTPYLGFSKLISPSMDLKNRRHRYRQRQDPEHEFP